MVPRMGGACPRGEERWDELLELGEGGQEDAQEALDCFEVLIGRMDALRGRGRPQRADRGRGVLLHGETLETFC